MCGCLRVRYPGDRGHRYGFMKAVDARTVVYERNITRDAQRAGLALDIFPLDRMYTAAVEEPPACLRASSSGSRRARSARG